MISSVLKTTRQQRRLSLGALALKSGVNKSTLSRWESGKTKPYAEELEKVFEALDIPEATRRACFKSLGAPRALRYLATPSTSQTLPISGGELLHALRLRANVTQTEAARATGVTQALLSKWEHNECWPDSDKLHHLCFALNATESEIRGLTTHAWRQHEETPLDKEGLDQTVRSLDSQDTFIDRDLYYLSLANRYHSLYRKNHISEIQSLEIWGTFGHFITWHGRHEDAFRFVMPLYTASKSSSRIFSQGQVEALLAIVNAMRHRQQNKLALETFLAFKERIAPYYYPNWLDEAAHLAEACEQLDLAYSFFEECLQLGNTLQEHQCHCQRYARMLCRQGRYGEALTQLATLSSPQTERRVSVRIERELVTAWALAGTKDSNHASTHLNTVLPLVEQHAFQDLTALSHYLVGFVADSR